MSLPVIRTALPKRRYQYGEFLLVLLGDIESSDAVPYQYLMGIVPAGKNQPELFISAEKVAKKGEDQAFQMRVIAEQVSQTVAHSDAWDDIEVFSHDALALCAQLLNLQDEEAMRMM
jgi:hypothetical protein